MVLDHIILFVQANLSIVVKEVRKAMEERINGLDWLSDATKERALKKLAFTESFLAYPMEINDNNYLESLYANVSICSLI